MNRTSNTDADPKSRRVARARRRAGSTLIDVATGSMILALLLIPSIHLIGKSQSSNRRLATREVILYETEQLLEKAKVAMAEPTVYDAAMTSPIDRTLSIPVSDLPDLVGRVRVASDASISPASLLTIRVDVWQDSNRNGSLDVGEPTESLRTQWAAP